MYDPNKCKAVGEKLVAMVEAVTKDGVGLEDLPEFLELVTALQAARTELETDTDAATLHILSGAADAFGTKRINPTA